MPSPGNSVGPYRLTQLLDERDGVSLFAASRAHSGRTPHRVAVRVASNAEDNDARRALTDEHRILQHLDDPRIPRVHGFWEALPALALTWIPGESLEEVMAERGGGSLDAPTTVAIGRDVALALAHAHSAEEPVVHADLGVHAVRLGEDGSVWVLGLGRQPSSRSVARPPEQRLGAFVDARADQWGLAALVLHLLRGQSLPPASDTEQVQAALEPVAARWPSLGVALGRALAPAAGERFRDMAGLAGALEAVSVELGETANVVGAVARLREARLQARAAEDAAKEAARRAAAEQAAAEAAAAAAKAAADAAAAAAAQSAAAAESSASTAAPGNRGTLIPDEVADPAAAAATAVDVEYIDSIDPTVGPSPAPPSVQGAVTEELEPTEIAGPESVPTDPDTPTAPEASRPPPLQGSEWAAVILSLAFFGLGLLWLAVRIW